MYSLFRTMSDKIVHNFKRPHNYNAFTKQIWFTHSQSSVSEEENICGRAAGYWMSSINAHLAEWSKRLLNIQLVEQAAMTTLCSRERFWENI